jgi:CHAD domain-containing protein
MEIEAKFAVADGDVLERLAGLPGLAGFTLGPVVVEEVEDTYLDTAERSLLGAGFTCRRRESIDGGVLMTIKSLAIGGGGVFRREELEVDLAEASLQPDEWPEGRARDRVIGLVGEEFLMPMLHLAQTRRTRSLTAEDRVVARMFLDDVRVTGSGRQHGFMEVEVELDLAGTEAELASVVDALSAEDGLAPADRPKFLRALALVESEEGTGLLLPHELVVSRRIAELEDAYGRRARALLALHEGATQVEAGERAGFSSRWARHWLAEFRRERLGIFPGEAFEGLWPAGAAEPAPAGAAEPAPAGARGVDEAVVAEPARPPAVAPRTSKERKTRPGVRATDTMAAAADKILLFHLERMIESEEGTRLGQDIEELHDMRVATRRMRAALRLLDPFLDAESMRPFLKALRRTGRTLGAVRDLDVFREKSEHYLQGLPDGHLADLEPLFSAWEEEHTLRRTEMLAYLDGHTYSSFKERFARFLDEPGAGAMKVVFDTGEVRPYRVADVVPYLLYEHAAQVWAYDEHTKGPLVPLVRFHNLRMASKGLRYAFEFFQEVLGPGAKDLINAIKRLQDHLGDLQDAVVTCNVLRDYLMWGTWGPPNEGKVTMPESVVVAPGVAAYMAARQAELQRLVNTFPGVWADVCGPDFRRRLAGMVAEV